MVLMMDTDALLARANEEREKIFLKYERGREGTDIDPWEDPDFSVYSHTDRYGFIHEKALPRDTDVNRLKRNAIELEREKKWLKMNQNWNSPKTQEKLRKRTIKGIPLKLRSLIWPKLLNTSKWISENQGTYQRMLTLARQYTTEARQVDADVNRQFRKHIIYRERFSVKQKSLFNVLTAYSIYNTEVGYCQGMAGVAGILLMYMDEEAAFWALNVLFTDEKYAMHGLFIEGFPKLTRFLVHHDKLLERFMPRLKKHFDKYDVDAILYSLKWFFVIFVERIPFSLALRVWDLYLLVGERVVTAMAYTILKLHKSRLMRLQDMDAIIEFLQVKLYQEFGFEDDHVIRAVEQTLFDLRRVGMDLPPAPGPNERPRMPLGQFVEPTIDSMIGHRKSMFTEAEIKVHDDVIMMHNSHNMHNGGGGGGAGAAGDGNNAIDDPNYSEYGNSEGINDENCADNTLSIKTYQSYNSLCTSIASTTCSISSRDEVTIL